jgi:hypothetical protein
MRLLAAIIITLAIFAALAAFAFALSHRSKERRGDGEGG